MNEPTGEPAQEPTLPHGRLRERMYVLLEIRTRHDRLGQFIDYALIALILLSVLDLMLLTVDAVVARVGGALYAFESFVVAVFSIEYVLRVWVCVENPERDYGHPFWGRLRYMKTPIAIIDLLAILPFYAGLVFAVPVSEAILLRVLRIFKLSHYSPALNLMMAVLRQELRTLTAAVSLLFSLLVLVATLIYLIERTAQPDAFGSIPEALWWAVTTITTVGYGDVVPVTFAGRVLGAAVMLVGVAIIAVPAGILSAGFIAEMGRRERKFREVATTALEDREISPREELLLERVRQRLGLSEEEAEFLVREVRRELLAADAAREKEAAAGSE
jgi:voltage-gated potassium channel